MPESEILNGLCQENTPRHLRLLGAQGLIPVPAEEMLLLLVRLVRDADPEISQTAAASMADFQENDIVPQLQSRACHPEVLAHFAASSHPAFHEAVILNPESPGPVVASLAARVAAPLLELILYNRARLTQYPEILQGIRINPAISPSILGMIREIEAELFGEKKRDYAVEAAAGDASAAEPGWELELEIAPEDLSLEGLPLDPQEREAAILNRLAGMTVPQKKRLAVMGSREIRAVLIRDSNREVARSVLQSPKLTGSEIESFSAMRNVSDEILRQLGNSKEWTRSYVVSHNLVKNPRTPPMISQRLLPRLLSKDLMLLARDRSITEAVRRNAQRLLSQRNASKPLR